MKRITGFFGSAGQVGVTMTAVSTAEAFAASGEEVLLISAAGKYGNDFLKEFDSVRSIDDLKADIINDNLKADEMKGVIVKEKGISYLGSVRNPFAVRSFPHNSIEKILDAAGKEYDHVIIDAGDDFNSGLAVSALNACDRRIFVLTQQPKTVERFKFIEGHVLSAMGLDSEIVINRYVKSSGLYSDREIEALTGKRAIGIIPESEWGIFAEISGKSLMDVKAYRKEIERMVGSFGGGEEQEKRTKLFSGGIFKRNRVGKG